MPIYEYTCSGCGRLFEQLVQSREQEAELACPHCGSRKLERQLSVPAAPRVAAGSTPPPPCGGCNQAGGSCPYR
ncbi:MAG: zinc ribbon domain-containing protein [Phycisphaerae bacterium]|jgi:putative FmdB family regulatory protein|nr:zinc ribbon domain-containing protein [Phycisphaerae bacterium]HOO17867.1 zinc ribbon domain-containing protein [Phycisphaerae bacterium]HPC23589.1 zinc ribbon domain-containing protein [Phycisphaerae bacterium]HRS28987.1 zinc ribbon domain-containing protein [Phycisphaerae bacterium]HRT43083.1 zinc ribbon domain-containing protein [Phycisphaerae bacterium]